VKKGDTIAISISKGHDMSVSYPLPDFMNMTHSEIEKWAKERYLSKLRVTTESSDTIPVGNVIRFEINDNKVINEVRRDTPIYIIVSTGEESALKNITVPDFKGKNKAEVDFWALENGITMTYEEKGSDSVPMDSVISQSVAPGEKIAKKDKITIVISLGEGVRVPNFNSIPRDLAASEVPGLMVSMISKYSATVPYGRMISQSVAAGTRLYGNDMKVTVTYSEGQPFIDNLIGGSEKDLPAYFYDFYAKGANITYSVTYVDSSEPKGTVISASKNSEFVAMSLVVYFEISKGNL
jgi:serine/threonine-protein kinase